MRNFHIKSVILGIGIGIVITSIISMIYAAGINPNKSISREEIITKAKELGMVDGTSILGTQQNDTDQNKDKEDLKDDSSLEKKSEKDNDEASSKNSENEATEDKKTVAQVQEVKERIVTVSPGDTSEAVASKLLQTGLISDKKGFINKLTDMGLEAEINVGEFKIKEGTSEADIIMIITGKR